MTLKFCSLTLATALAMSSAASANAQLSEIVVTATRLPESG